MIAAILIGLLTFIVLNFFIQAGVAALIGVIVGILVYLGNRPDRL